MSNPSEPRLPRGLTREDEERVFQALLGLNWSETYESDAAQAIGQVLGIDTSKARLILDEFISQNRLRARSQGANNMFETGTVRPMLCKWFTRNPYDTMRAKVAEILRYEADLPSTEHDFKAVVTKDGKLLLRPRQP
jgi:hypothetical protein